MSVHPAVRDFAILLALAILGYPFWGQWWADLESWYNRKRPHRATRKRVREYIMGKR